MDERNSIELTTPVPKFTTFTCKAYTLLIVIGLQSAHILAALFVWYRYDYFFALATLLVGYIAVGIVRSKLRNGSIPLLQREYDYNDHEIARWYLARTLCFKANRE